MRGSLHSVRKARTSVEMTVVGAALRFEMTVVIGTEWVGV
jgi:hypothetical protein